jgi:hypothetical protein
MDEIDTKVSFYSLQFYTANLLTVISCKWMKLNYVHGM